MSDYPIEPTAPVTGEGVAERYVEHELIASRASLRRTQVVGSLLTVFVVAYLAYLTSGFHSNLEPNGAAEVATGLVAQRVDDLTPQFASYIREEVPKAIRNAPDEIIKRMPQYRENLESRVEETLRVRSNEAAKRLNGEMMSYLTAHKDQVAELIKNGNDPAAAQSLGQGLEDQFRTFLKEQPVGDSSIQAKLDETLRTLNLVQARTARLAAGKGLNPSEQKARHAVAMLMHRIDDAKASSPALPTIDTTQVHEAIDNAASGVRDAVATGTGKGSM